VRNIPIDLARFTFVCVSPPRPKLVSMETGEVKQDKDGNTVFTVGLSAADNTTGRVELVNVAVSGDPGVSVGQVVQPLGLTAIPWEQRRGGELRWGLAFRASQIVPAVPGVQAA
jgi:hypothetical protein